jgi:hypothetical protein
VVDNMVENQPRSSKEGKKCWHGVQYKILQTRNGLKGVKSVLLLGPRCRNTDLEAHYLPCKSFPLCIEVVKEVFIVYNDIRNLNTYLKLLFSFLPKKAPIVCSKLLL